MGAPLKAQGATHRGSPLSKLTGGDGPLDLLYVVAFFVAYFAIDVGTRLLATTNNQFLGDPVLIVGAFKTRTFLWMVAAVVFIATVWLWRQRLWCRWQDLDRGRVLRVFSIPLIALLTWQGSLYEFNFLFGQTHLGDRLLLVGLAIATIYRPFFLGFFVLQSRVIAGQFEYPLGTTAAQNIDELLIMVLAAVAAVHLIYVATGRRRSAPVLLVITAAVATHFFIPGRSKLGLDWLSSNDASNLPFSAFTAGWQAQGDGSWAAIVSRPIMSLAWPIGVATLLIELGSVLALMHRQLMRVWLPFAILFHVSLFAITGFWFLSWIVLEVALLVLLSRPALRPWVDENATPARVLITVVAVVAFGAILFHPPRLAWLDGPVSSGYRIEATGESGQLYNVPISAFAPVVQDLTFFNLVLTPSTPPGGGYGAVGSPERLERLQEADTIDDLQSLATPTQPGLVDISGEFFVRFVASANARGRSAWSVLSPPDHFWTGAPAPVYDFGEPIASLNVLVRTAINDNGEETVSDDSVLTVVAEDSVVGVFRPDS